MALIINWRTSKSKMEKKKSKSEADEAYLQKRQPRLWLREWRFEQASAVGGCAVRRRSFRPRRWRWPASACWSAESWTEGRSRVETSRGGTRCNARWLCETPRWRKSTQKNKRRVLIYQTYGNVGFIKLKLLNKIRSELHDKAYNDKRIQSRKY